MKKNKIHIIAVAFEKLGQLKVFVQSWVNQTNDNWHLTVIHDGPNLEFEQIMESFVGAKTNIDFFNTNSRYNDYGHSLRQIGLNDIKGDYVMLTNADNYFIPKAIEYLNEILSESDPDVIIYDMVHSHIKPGGRNLPADSHFETSYARFSLDVSAAIVKKELAKKAGFQDKTHDGDATYFEDVRRSKDGISLDVIKLPRILFVHN